MSEARAGLPDALAAPTGSRKTAACTREHPSRLGIEEVRVHVLVGGAADDRSIDG